MIQFLYVYAVFPFFIKEFVIFVALVNQWQPLPSSGCPLGTRALTSSSYVGDLSGMLFVVPCWFAAFDDADAQALLFGLQAFAGRASFW